MKSPLQWSKVLALAFVGRVGMTQDSANCLPVVGNWTWTADEVNPRQLLPPGHPMQQGG